MPGQFADLQVNTTDLFAAVKAAWKAQQTKDEAAGEEEIPDEKEAATTIEEDTTVSEDDQFFPYKAYGIRGALGRSLGRMFLPVAATAIGGPAATASRVATVCSVWGYVVTSWTATRKGAPPAVPAPKESTTRILIGTDVSPMALMPTGDGVGKEYSITGCYYYIDLAPLIPGEDDIPVPQSPLMDATTDDLPADLFSSELG